MSGVRSISMSMEKNKQYFNALQIEPLTSNIKNKGLLSEFVSKKKNNSLESYLKEDAWKEDTEGTTRVYLVKDDRDCVAAFFSIKCGLLIGENLDEKLPEQQRMFVNSIIDLLDEKDSSSEKQKLFDAGQSLFGEEVDKLFEIAERIHTRKNESKIIKQHESTQPVPNCIPAIEIQHFCKNENFTLPDEIKVPLGFGIFWEKIVPLLLQLTEKVGCKYIYLFAADKSDANSTNKRLIDYYIEDFKFSECDIGMKFVKPDYDEGCYGLVQPVSMLKKNKEDVWSEFSDVFS